MLQVSLDTSFLISFADPSRPNHYVAVEYFRHCVSEKIPMWISVIAAGEFHVGQRFADLPLQHFRLHPYNLQHAIKSAEFFKSLWSSDQGSEEPRKVIINDLKLLAQAEEEEIPIILSEDENTLSRLACRLNAVHISNVKVLLLSEGFSPTRFTNPDQLELDLQS